MTKPSAPEVSWPGRSLAFARPDSAEITDIAYVAGLFDGEGCITTYISSPGSTRPRLSLSLACCFKDTLDWIKTIFGGTVRPNQNSSTNKTVYVWKPGTIPEKLAFLEAVAPFLREKRTQADLAIAYLRIRVSQQRRDSHAKSAWMDALALSLRNSLRDIKQSRSVMALQGTRSTLSPEESRLL